MIIITKFYFFFNFDLKKLFSLAPQIPTIIQRTKLENFMDSRSSSRTSSIGNHGKIQSARLQLEIKVEIVAQWSHLSTSWILCAVSRLWSKVFAHRDDNHVVLDVTGSRNPSDHLYSSKNSNWIDRSITT